MHPPAPGAAKKASIGSFLKGKNARTNVSTNSYAIDNMRGDAKRVVSVLSSKEERLHIILCNNYFKESS